MGSGSRNDSQITPRKGVKGPQYAQSKKNLENYSSGFTAKDTKRVLNMKDMNNKNNQLNTKINDCFGDFYKKLDTFADRGKDNFSLFK